MNQYTDEMGAASRDLALVEAALFLSPQPMTRRGLAKLLGGVQLAYVDQLLDELTTELDPSAHGIELWTEDGRATLRVRAEFVEQVAHLAPQQDIPRPLLRTLAVIAYNHPMTQADLVRVRGNKAYGHVQELRERGLIRAEDHGKTLLLHVTKEFLHSFGLRTVEEFRFHVAAAPGEEEQENADVDAPAAAAGDAADDAPQLPSMEPEIMTVREADEPREVEAETSSMPEADASEDDLPTHSEEEEGGDAEAADNMLTESTPEPTPEEDEDESDSDQEVRDG